MAVKLNGKSSHYLLSGLYLERGETMGMDASVRVVGIVDDKDPDWDYHKQIWDSCQMLDIDPPKETKAYFGGGDPTGLGLEVRIGSNAIRHVSIKNSEDNSRYSDLKTPGCYVIDLSRIPAKVRKLAVWIDVSV